MFRNLEDPLEQVVIFGQFRLPVPLGEGFSGMLVNLELDRLVGFLLHDHSAGLHLGAVGDIGHLQFHQVTTPELAIDGEIE
jgi:hypothetical protein